VSGERSGPLLAVINGHDREPEMIQPRPTGANLDAGPLVLPFFLVADVPPATSGKESDNDRT